MNLYTLLQRRAHSENPIRVGIIGAGKFGTMFLSQARLTPGMQVVGIAELDPEKAREACRKTGWPPESISACSTTGAINDAARADKTALTQDSSALIEAELNVILEITGVPEAGSIHAWKALGAGKHVVMVNVEADCLVGPAIRKKADEAGRVYSMAYGDQPALILDQIEWARAGAFRNISTCLPPTPTSSFPSSAKRWGCWEQ